MTSSRKPEKTATRPKRNTITKTFPETVPVSPEKKYPHTSKRSPGQTAETESTSSQVKEKTVPNDMGKNTGNGTGENSGTPQYRIRNGGGFQIMRCISPKHGVLPIGKYNVPPGISPKSLAIPSRTTVIHQFLNVFCRAPIRQQDAFFCFSQISGKTFTENSVFAVRTSLLQTRKSVCAKCAYDGSFSFLKRLLNSG